MDGGECITDGRLLIHYSAHARRANRLGGAAAPWATRPPHGRVELDRDLPPVIAATSSASSRRSAAAAHPRLGRPRRLPQSRPQTALPAVPCLRLRHRERRGPPTSPADAGPRWLWIVATNNTRCVVESGAGAWVPPEPFAWAGRSVVRTRWCGASTRRRWTIGSTAHAGDLRGSEGARHAFGPLSVICPPPVGYSMAAVADGRGVRSHRTIAVPCGSGVLHLRARGGGAWPSAPPMATATRSPPLRELRGRVYT